MSDETDGFQESGDVMIRRVLMVRHIVSRIPKIPKGRLKRVVPAAAALLVGGAGLLAISGPASADTNDKQISITMHPDGQMMYRAVSVCGLNENNEEKCAYLAYHGDSVFYEAGPRFHGEVEVAAERSSGRAWEFKTFTLCDSQQGDWAYLKWWDPMAACQADAEPALRGSDAPLPGELLRTDEEWVSAE